MTGHDYRATRLIPSAPAWGWAPSQALVSDEAGLTRLTSALALSSLTCCLKDSSLASRSPKPSCFSTLGGGYRTNLQALQSLPAGSLH